jgi:hypothetical protein
MRAWVLILVAILLGVGMGFGGTLAELGASPSGDVASSFSGKIAPVAGPKAGTDEDEFKFGTMEYDGRSSHKFAVRNEGKQPLKLTFDHVSCGLCTQAKIEKENLQPGEESFVTVSWHANKEGPFQQSATIGTNDPRKPKLVFNINGKVLNTHRVEPPELVFTSIAVTDTQSADLKIFCYRPETLEVVKHEFSDAETADKFEVRTEPMPASMLATDEDAKSGVLVHVTVKPGLPLGPIRQKIKLQLNLPNDPVIEIPITGNITSDVMLIGRGWDSEKELLNLGVISTKEGAKVNLMLQFHGEQRQNSHPTITSINPSDLLKVSIGDAKESPDGRTVRVPIAVEIPAGSRQATHLGGLEGKLGEINIDLNDSTKEKMRIFVRFAVGE